VTQDDSSRLTHADDRWKYAAVFVHTRAFKKMSLLFGPFVRETPLPEAVCPVCHLQLCEPPSRPKSLYKCGACGLSTHSKCMPRWVVAKGNKTCPYAQNPRVRCSAAIKTEDLMRIGDMFESKMYEFQTKTDRRLTNIETSLGQISNVVSTIATRLSKISDRLGLDD